MIGLAATFALALAAPPQEACAPRDTACQIGRLEGRITALERRLAEAERPPSGLVEISVDYRCGDYAACNRQARRECAESGFTRGVASSKTPNPTGPGFWVVRAQCTG